MRLRLGGAWGLGVELGMERQSGRAGVAGCGRWGRGRKRAREKARAWARESGIDLIDMGAR